MTKIFLKSRFLCTNNSDEFLNLLCLQQSKYCPLGSPMASRLENLCPSVVQGSRNSSSTVAAPSLSLFLYGIEAWRLLSPSCNTLSYTPKNHPKTSYVYPLLNQDKKVGKSIILLYKIFYSQPKNKLPLHISNKNSKKNGSYLGINFRIIIGQI